MHRCYLRLSAILFFKSLALCTHGFPVILAQRGVCVHCCVAAEASSWRTASAPPGPLVEWVRLASCAVATGRKEFEGQSRPRPVTEARVVLLGILFCVGSEQVRCECNAMKA